MMYHGMNGARTGRSFVVVLAMYPLNTNRHIRGLRHFLLHTLAQQEMVQIIVSTAHMAFVPDLKIGVVMAGNGPGMAYNTIAQSVMALLMGFDPDEVLAGPRIKRLMKRLTGDYGTYRDLAQIKVFVRDGLLYMGDEDSATPLVPNDLKYESNEFSTYREGQKSPVLFRVQDDGKIDLVVGRSIYHKQ